MSNEWRSSDEDFEKLVSVERRIAQFAVELKTKVKASGLTQQQLADRMGCSRGKVRRILDLPMGASFGTLARLCWACGIDPEFLPRET